MKKIGSWVISIGMLLFAVVGFSGSFLSGLFFLLGAVAANPVIYNVMKLKIKGLIKYSAVGVLFVVGCMCFSESAGGQSTVVAEPAVVAEQGITMQESTKNQAVESADVFKQTEKKSPEENETTKLTVHFIDVGQGDCSLVVCDGEAMLIDAGDNDKGTKVQLYLEKQGIKKLKYVIGTHPDADHIGGMDVVLYKFDCENVIMSERDKDTATYRDVLDVMKTKGYSNTLPVVGDEYSLGGATFTIVGPERDYDDINDCSVAIVLRHGENSFLFTGDCEAEAESDMVNSGVDIDVDVYQVGHHGSDSSSGEEFLNAITPECAVISCEEGNEYGHPHAGTMNRLRAMGVQVYRTDEQGSITVTSDGTSYVWSCSPSETWKAGERTGSNRPVESTASSVVPTPSKVSGEIQESVAPSEEKALTYMLNTNTKKFHHYTCKEVNKMAEKNKQISNDSRESIIAQGYVPCKKCNP